MQVFHNVNIVLCYLYILRTIAVLSSLHYMWCGTKSKQRVWWYGLCWCRYYRNQSGLCGEARLIPSFSFFVMDYFRSSYCGHHVLSNSLAIDKIAPYLIFNNTSLDISKNGSLLMAFVGLRSIYQYHIIMSIITYASLS